MIFNSVTFLLYDTKPAIFQNFLKFSSNCQLTSSFLLALFKLHFQDISRTDLKKIKQIPKETYYQVLCYLNNNQRTLHLPNIPMLVFHKCLCFAQGEDYFQKDNLPEFYQLSNNQQTLISKPNSFLRLNGDAVGTVAIDNTSKIIASWKIKINKCRTDQKRAIRLGLKGSEHAPNNYQFYISNDGWIYIAYAFIAQVHHQSIRFSQGDELSIILDLYHKQIRYKLNNESEQCLISLKYIPREPRTYKLFVNFEGQTNSISIVDFSIIHKH